MERRGRGYVYHPASWVEVDIGAGNGSLSDGYYTVMWIFFLPGDEGISLRGVNFETQVHLVPLQKWDHLALLFTHFQIYIWRDYYVQVIGI